MLQGVKDSSQMKLCLNVVFTKSMYYLVYKVHFS